MSESIDLISGVTLSGGCGCGGQSTGGCGCGHHHGHGHAGDSAARESTDGAVATFGVRGMTCEHCVASVTEEISEYAGVTGVSVDLQPGGISAVTVTSTEPLDRANIEAAIRDAGYEPAAD